REHLLSVASSKINWLQDAAELGIATEDESAELLEWRKYRVLLMRVDISKAPDINWPEIPA
ncbi:TPA: tail fiber assembly protein, partial [Enterobacter kobei]